MAIDLGKFDIRKTVTDAGYVTVGIGVLGFQQAQVRRRELQKRLGETGGCLNARAIDGKARLDSLQHTVGETTQDLRDRIETGARSANDWAQELGVTIKDRIEPVVGPFVEQVGDRVKTVVPGRGNGAASSAA
jgi:phage tail tape-measure protein